jgi:hypothetical protein
MKQSSESDSLGVGHRRCFSFSPYFMRVLGAMVSKLTLGAISEKWCNIKNNVRKALFPRPQCHSLKSAF